MSPDQANSSRRDFWKASGGLAVGATFVGAMAVPRAVHAGVSEKMRIGLIGCGGRGTGAAENALNASPDNVLVAVGDAFEDYAENSARGATSGSMKSRTACKCPTTTCSSASTATSR